jgi:hypothetical protein
MALPAFVLGTDDPTTEAYRVEDGGTNDLRPIPTSIIAGGGASSFVFDPSQPLLTGPVVFGTFGAAVDAAKAAAVGGADPVATIFCRLQGTSVIVAPRAYDLKNIRLVGDLAGSGGLSELRFPVGSSWTNPPLSAESIAITSAVAGPLYTLAAGELLPLDLFGVTFGRPTDSPMLELSALGPPQSVLGLSARQSLLNSVANISEGQIGVTLYESNLGINAFQTTLGGGTQALSVAADGLSTVNDQALWTFGVKNFTRAPVNFSDTVATAEATASVVYTDLATLGPSVDVVTGTTALMAISSKALVAALAAGDAAIAVDVSGSTTIAAADSNGAKGSTVTSGNETLTRVFRIRGLNPGLNTFTLKYKTVAASFTFSDRDITYLGA